jgi:hypothetical protein
MGESFVFTVPVPAGAERWRVPVLWQRQELSRSEEFVTTPVKRVNAILYPPFSILVCGLAALRLLLLRT